MAVGRGSRNRGCTARRASLLAAVVFAAALAGGAVAVSTGGLTRQASARATLACRFGKGDLLCVKKQAVFVFPRRRRGGSVRQLRPASTVAARARGRARVLLRRQASCDVLGRGRLTTIVTRRPRGGFLMTQLRGETLCTIAGEQRVFVAANASLTPRGLTGARQAPFRAVIRESPDRGGPAQYRVRVAPGKAFGIAVSRGGLSVALPSGRRNVGAGSELLGRLTGSNAIVPSSVHTASAHFDSAEQTLLDDQASSWFVLVLNLSGNGVVTSQPAGIDCGTDCAEGYASGTVVSLRAKPDPGWVFAGWDGDCTGAAKTCKVAMDDGRTVDATFEPQVG